MPAHAAPMGVAVLQGLDKVTGRITTLNAPLNAPVYFGRLQVTVRACHKAPPEERPEATAFIEVIDTKPRQEAKRDDGKPGPIDSVFSGWMFASSPSISAMEHPVYDLSVIDCKNPKTD
ncbi:MAG: DUF2155 domain-containing protein [Dongiaceae bacterium]